MLNGKKMKPLIIFIANFIHIGLYIYTLYVQVTHFNVKFNYG